MVIKAKSSTIISFWSALICTAIIICAVFDPLFPAKADSNGFSIIMYHHITNDLNKVGDYVIFNEDLEKDFIYLKNAGYKTLSVKDLYAINSGEMELPEKSVMITFDDGQESFYEYAYPLLKKYGFCAVFSIIGKYSELFSEHEDHNIAYSHVTWEQIRKMSESGIVEFGNHSYDMHKNGKAQRHGILKMDGETDELYEKALIADIDKFNSLFKENVGYVPDFFTYPFGKYSDLGAQIIKSKGYSATFTCYEKKNIPLKEKEWLFSLGRYNRSGKTSTENFFKKVL